jgi:protein-S-isoprenylcysteine O-methyltransferase Ste14
MTAEELQLRRAVVCASGLVYWGGVMVQARRVRKQIGRSPNVRPQGGKERALWFGWFLVIMAWIGQPLWVGATLASPGLAVLPGLLHPAGLALGLGLVVLGYAGTLWTYAAMGNSWRMGVNANEKTALVSRGPFRWVRHPIYLLQILMLAGAALLLPTPVSFVALATHYVCVRLKAMDEEKFLTRVHGAVYREYMSRTGGLCPRLFRRPGPATGAHQTGVDFSA